MIKMTCGLLIACFELFGVDFVNSVGMKFKDIQAAGFYIQESEVTKKQWYEIMGSVNRTPLELADINMPMESVSWYDVQEFIQKLNLKEQTVTYSLPTEEEWEYTLNTNSRIYRNIAEWTDSWYDRDYESNNSNEYKIILGDNNQLPNHIGSARYASMPGSYSRSLGFRLVKTK